MKIMMMLFCGFISSNFITIHSDYKGKMIYICIYLDTILLEGTYKDDL